jgi:hypothetical protein
VSDPSRAPEADGDLTARNYNGYVSASARVLEHPGNPLGVGFYVYVLNLVSPIGIVLTGSRGVGSGVLAEYKYLFSHLRLLSHMAFFIIIVKRGEMTSLILNSGLIDKAPTYLLLTTPTLSQ